MAVAKTERICKIIQVVERGPKDVQPDIGVLQDIEKAVEADCKEAENDLILHLGQAFHANDDHWSGINLFNTMKSNQAHQVK